MELLNMKIKSQTLLFFKKNGKAINQAPWAATMGLTPIFMQLDQHDKQAYLFGIDQSFIAFGIPRCLVESPEQQIRQVLDVIYSKKQQVEKIIKDHCLTLHFETKVWFGEEDKKIPFEKDIFKKSA